MFVYTQVYALRAEHEENSIVQSALDTVDNALGGTGRRSVQTGGFGVCARSRGRRKCNDFCVRGPVSPSSVWCAF